ncbi:hypothetical protein [Nonomuraea sediminis]|uniref:hypothetical protein n=1 Tax=Nonomuraea sediminis TaxID=2835864 RepID=UPI001BDDB5F3|nr:hypothetical protein [Nonomuraea sediminis]
MRRYWPALAFVCIAVVLTVAATGGNLWPADDDIVPTFLVIAAVALTVPRGLTDADGLWARFKRVPEAYGAVAVSAASAFALLAPFDVGVMVTLIPTLSISALALLCLAVFRVQVHNERTARPRMRQHATDDLEERFTAMAHQLSESAAAFALLQAEMAARAHAAQELALEAEENRRHAEQSRTYAEDQKAALEAVERLVAARADPIVEAIERRSRRSQVIFLTVGAILGTVLQLLAEKLFKG